MAIKRRPTDEDDEERPRRKRRPDDDDDGDEEEEDRPKRRRARAEEDEDDDEDRPRKRRPSRDEADDDDEDERPAKRRRSRDEDEDEADEEDRPRKGRKPKPKDDDEDEDEDDESQSKKKKKPEAKPAKPKPELDDDDAAYEAWQKQKVVMRKQYVALQAGLDQFGKRVPMYIMCLAGCIGSAVLFYFMTSLLGDDYLKYLVYLMIIVLGVVPPLFSIQAIGKCRQGPPEFKGESFLGAEMIICIVIMLLYVACVGSLLLLEPDRSVSTPSPASAPAKTADAGAKAGPSEEVKNAWILFFATSASLFALGYFAYMASFLDELFYFKSFAKFMKDKITLNKASAAIMHFICFAFIAVPIVGAAGYFLHFTSMGKLGDALAGVLGIIWLLAVFKGVMDVKRTAEALSLTINKKLTADDKPNW